MFIQLTDSTNGNVLSVNSDHIVYIEPSAGRSNVYLSIHGMIRASESREQIVAMAQPAIVEAVESEEAPVEPEQTPVVEPTPETPEEPAQEATPAPSGRKSRG